MIQVGDVIHYTAYWWGRWGNEEGAMDTEKDMAKDVVLSVNHKPDELGRYRIKSRRIGYKGAGEAEYHR